MLTIFGARVKYSIGAVKIDTLIIYEITSLRIADKVKHALRSELSIYEIMQILSISVFDKTSLKELLTEYNTNQNVKEQRNLFSD